jgi:hypothetical protein
MGEPTPTDSTFRPDPSATQGEDAVWRRWFLTNALRGPMPNSQCPQKKPGIYIPSSKHTRISVES